MSHIPTPIRAVLGLAATAVAEARKLPETLPQLPVTAVSTAMQASLRVQQHIATFAARGDEVISQLRGTSAEPPSWATFDDAQDGARPTSAFDRATPADLEDTGAGPGAAEPAHSIDTEAIDTEAIDTEAIDTEAAVSGEPAIPIDGPRVTAPSAVPTKDAPPAKKAAKAQPAKAAKKAPAKAAKAAPAKAPAKKAPARKVAKRSEPLIEAAKKADPSSGPNPSTMAAEILQAHQAPTGQ